MGSIGGGVMNFAKKELVEVGKCIASKGKATIKKLVVDHLKSIMGGRRRLNWILQKGCNLVKGTGVGFCKGLAGKALEALEGKITNAKVKAAWGSAVKPC